MGQLAIRSLVACALLLALLGASTPPGRAAPAAAQEATPVAPATEPAPTAGSVTIAKATCPPGYAGDDFLADCAGNPTPGVTFAVLALKADFSVSGVTDANGLVTLPLPDDPPGGFVTVGESPPVEVPGGAAPPFVIACTKTGGAEPVAVDYSLVQLDPGGDAYFASLAVAPGDEIRCDWYNIPPATQTATPPVEEGGSLTLYATTCPPGYVLEPGREDALFADCFGNPAAGVRVLASGRIGVIPEATTDAGGFVSFSYDEMGVSEPESPAGEEEAGISVGVELPAAIERFAAFCAKNDGEEVTADPRAAGVGGLPGFGIPGTQVEPGDAIRCDVYLIPVPIAPTPTPTTVPPVSGDLTTDVELLNALLRFARLQLAFYDAGLAAFDDADFAAIATEPAFEPTAGGDDEEPAAEATPSRARLAEIRDQQAAHVEALTGLIDDLGGTAIDEEAYDFGVQDLPGFLAVGQELENRSVAAYASAALLVADAAARELVVGILSVEARQAAYLNLLTNQSPFPSAIDEPFSRQEVLTATDHVLDAEATD